MSKGKIADSGNPCTQNKPTFSILFVLNWSFFFIGKTGSTSAGFVSKAVHLGQNGNYLNVILLESSLRPPSSNAKQHHQPWMQHSSVAAVCCDQLHKHLLITKTTQTYSEWSQTFSQAQLWSILYAVKTQQSPCFTSSQGWGGVVSGVWGGQLQVHINILTESGRPVLPVPIRRPCAAANLLIK